MKFLNPLAAIPSTPFNFTSVISDSDGAINLLKVKTSAKISQIRFKN